MKSKPNHRQHGNVRGDDDQLPTEWVCTGNRPTNRDYDGRNDE
jgi:hypothetical protein